MNGTIRQALDWVDHRTGIETAINNFMAERIPASAGWRHVFGSVALFLFLIQIFTGILLAFNYAPQPGAAYYSLQYIVEQLTAGRLIRGLHHWGSSMMVVIVVLHMVQVGLWGAYKKPRETTWMVGVFLLLLVLGFGLTGYLLPWDNRAYWSTVVTIQISGLAPGLGEAMMRVLGSTDGSVGVATFSRFYSLHVLVLPAITAMLVVLHLHLVRKHGIAPEPEDTHRPTARFYPRQAFKDTVAVFTAFVILFVLAVAVDVPLERLADPTDSTYVPRPEWYFLFLFQTLKFFEGSMEVVGAIVLPTLAIIGLLLVPFIDRSEMKRIGQRIMAFAVVGLVAVGWMGLTVGAIFTTPASQQASDSDGGVVAWNRLTPVELAGQAFYRREKCGNCHNLVDGDPKMGPTLATVSDRKAANWMIEHFKNPSAVVPGSPMPALQISDAELNSLSAYLLSVTPENAVALEQVPNFAMQGAMVYQLNMCGNCHKVNGVGQTIGPPLNGVGERRTKQWLVDHFRNPQSLVPTSTMPPYDFPPNEMEAIVSYLQALPASGT
ncbi:MAG: cytochrome b N-terminal domain-containing protein [Acidobacteria bacterium]|nr:cytochrome b N-terminal domain-containing protein [Acidobacteriota bacterium]